MTHAVFSDASHFDEAAAQTDSTAHKIARTPLRKEALFTRLANERQMTALIDKEIIAGLAPFQFNTENWVKMWVDTENIRHSDCGSLSATRAITVCGDLCWYVAAGGKRHGYHSLADDPHEAMEEAQIAWANRSLIRKRHWDTIEDQAAMLRRRKEVFDVTIEDAYRSPLCTLGIQCFLQRFRINSNRISGMTAGYLMLIENQMGFVLFEAMKRRSEAG